MAKLTRHVRDLKTVRETELSISRRFRRALDGLDYDRLRSDLRVMFKDGMGRGAYTVFYFSFTFNVLNVDTDEVSPEIQRYIMESLKKRFKGRFDEIESAPEADVNNWRIFTTAYKARRAELETFLLSLEELFDREVLSKFNAEIDHEILLTGAVLIFKRSRREVKPRRGVRKLRKRSRVRIVVYKVKGHKVRKRKRRAVRTKRRRQTVKRRTVQSVKRTRKVTKKARRRIKKSRRF